MTRALVVTVLPLALAPACGDGSDTRPAATGAPTTGDEAGDRSDRADPACTPAPERIVDGEAFTATNLLADTGATSLDTDGDGRDDEVEVSAGQVRVRRADGLVVLAAPGHDVSILTWADLDGDGRDDLLVRDEEGSGHRVVAVPGATGVGTHAPSAAGIRVDDDLTQVWPDDLDGEPGHDLVVVHRDGAASRTEVYSGADLLDRGPGGDGRDLPVARELLGLPRGVVALTNGGPPETLLYLPGTPASVRFADRPEVALTADLGPVQRVEEVLVFDEGGSRKVGLRVDRRIAVWGVPPACA